MCLERHFAQARKVGWTRPFSHNIRQRRRSSNRCRMCGDILRLSIIVGVMEFRRIWSEPCKRVTPSYAFSA